MIRTLLTHLLLVASTAAGAHEFWLLPDRFRTDAPDQPVALTLLVGEHFEGERVAFSQPLVAHFVHVSLRGSRDLRAAIGPGVRPEFRLAPSQAGTHLLALTTHPSEIVMAPDKFNAYLRDEGLEAVIAQREAAGQAAAPGRERYRRTIKTLLQIGTAADRTYARTVGQRLELVPLSNPAGVPAGGELDLRLLFDGSALPGALVKLWKREGSQTLVLPARTDAQGVVRVKLPATGTWMASVVHMVPAGDAPRHDWDSYWANLTFEAGGATAAAAAD